MEQSQCPECGAPVQSTDAHCMECGADLLTARQREQKQWRQQSVAARTGARPDAADSAGGAYVKPGETSERTRMRIFDQQEAKQLAQERVSVLVTAVLVGIPSLALLVVGLMRLHSIGFSELGTLRVGEFRQWAILTDPRLVTIILTGLGLAGTMCTAGLVRRGMMASRAIGEVKRGEKPTIVSLSWLTYYGLLLVAVFCPPLGLLLGILLKFSADEDIKNMAGTMIIISLVVMAVFGANALLGLAEGLKSAPPAQPTAPES